jgi:hypothetical protein
MIFGALRLAELHGWIKSGDQPAAVFLAYSSVFYFWQAITLDDDWKRRLKPRGYPFAFFMFCAAYGAVAFILSFYLFIRLDGGSGNNQPALLMLMMFIAEAMVLLIVAVAFANFLLYLPAYVAGVPWGVVGALRRASGVRLRLVGLAVFCTFLSLIGVLSLIALTFLRLPDAPWVNALARGMAVLIDLLALYVAAYGLSRLFIERSGWKLKSLPAT